MLLNNLIQRFTIVEIIVDIVPPWIELLNTGITIHILEGSCVVSTFLSRIIYCGKSWLTKQLLNRLRMIQSILLSTYYYSLY